MERDRSVRAWAAVTTTRASWRAWQAPRCAPRRLPRVLPASQARRRDAGQVSRRPARCPAPVAGFPSTHRAGHGSTCLSGLDAAALAILGAGCLGVVVVAGPARDELARRRSAWRPAAGPCAGHRPYTATVADGMRAPVLANDALAPTGTWGTAHGRKRWPTGAAVARLRLRLFATSRGKPTLSQPALIRARASGHQMPTWRSQRICLVCSVNDAVNLLSCSTCAYLDGRPVLTCAAFPGRR
jgi:hypothetical protein